MLKKVFLVGLTTLSNFINVNSLLSATPLNCTSMKNQECKTRLQVININSNNPIFYPFSIKTSKCNCNNINYPYGMVIVIILWSGSCNNINYPHATICIPDVVKNLNVKVFNLMSRTNDTRFLKWREKCNGKCKLDAIVLIINNVGIKINLDVNEKN